MIHNHFRSGHLSAPLHIPGHDFPIVQYADDTLVIMNGSSGRMQILMNTWRISLWLRGSGLVLLSPAANFYTFLFDGLQADPIFPKIWKSKC